MTNTETTTNKIAQLNDQFRRTFSGGQVMTTASISELDVISQAKIFKLVREFDNFTESNDPYGEHDFGTITLNNQKIFWKIDCYDKTMEFGSENPADPSVTTRVLTIMFASEY
jgi:hypothetical protein